MIEEFTPLQQSKLSTLNIRPKGDTPLGAALELALQKLDAHQKRYRAENIKSVTPQMIVLTDGKSSDDHSFAVKRINAMVNTGELICRTIALGETPDMRVLNQIGSVVNIQDNSMPEAFADAGCAVSQVYEEEIPEVIMNNPGAEQISDVTEYIIDGAYFSTFFRQSAGIFNSRQSHRKYRKLLVFREKNAKKMVARAGIEPTTNCLEGSCSIH